MNASGTTLHGRWLVVARTAWMQVATLAIGVTLAGIPPSMAKAQQICVGNMDTCTGRLMLDTLRVLQQLELTATFYAWYGIVLGLIFIVVWVGIALLVFTRASGNVMALLVSIWLVLFGTLFSSWPAAFVEAHPGWWFPVQFLWFLGGTGLFLCCYLFPDGRFVPGWTRWFTAVLGVGMAINFLFPASPLAPGYWMPELLARQLFVGVLGTLVFVPVYRYRYVSSSVQRQQTKWVVFGVSITVLAFVAVVLVPRALFPSITERGYAAGIFTLVGAPLFGLALVPLPIALSLAILYGRLWDIDVLINRILVYGTLTALLAAIYVGAVTVLQQIFAPLIGGSDQISIVASTLVIAALFNPLRRRIQAIIDQRFYRRKYDAQQTLQAFSARLRDKTDLEMLTQDLTMVVQETLQPAHVSLWLAEGGLRSVEHPSEVK